MKKDHPLKPEVFHPFDNEPTISKDINPYFQEYNTQKTNPHSHIIGEQKLKDILGNWKQEFKTEKSTGNIYLEIGCHLGKTINEAAEKHPENMFIGMDITYKRVVTTAQRSREHGRENLKVMKLDARYLPEIFAPGELSGVMIFFPDPWPKKKHRKHRLINEAFLQSILPLIKKSGWLWVKMDQKDYFEEVLAAVKSQPLLETQNIPFDLEPTTFQKKFMNEGLPTYQGVWNYM